MQGTLHHPWQWMHMEALTAGRWCSRHLIHDHRVWLYLLLALIAAAIVVLMFSAGQGIPVERDLQYYAYPYGF